MAMTIKPIPPQVINEGAAYGPFQLLAFVENVHVDAVLHCTASLKNGAALPKGLICTEDGVLTGIPAKNTSGNYDVLLTIESDGVKTMAEFQLTIKPNLAAEQPEDYLNKLKEQVWEALDQELPIPAELTAMYDREITLADVYYLWERWGILKIWNADDLSPPSEKKLIHLDGVSPHFNVYDRGTSLIGAPKDLFSHERTLADGLQTAKAIAKEVYKRGWTADLAGFEKYTRAAWVEFQRLGDQYGKRLEIINFQPTLNDARLYQLEELLSPVRKSRPEPE